MASSLLSPFTGIRPLSNGSPNLHWILPHFSSWCFPCTSNLVQVSALERPKHCSLWTQAFLHALAISWRLQNWVGWLIWLQFGIYQKDSVVLVNQQRYLNGLWQGDGGLRPGDNSNWDQHMLAAGSVNIGIMLIQRSSSLNLLSLRLELMLPCLVFLWLPKKK